MFRELKRIFDPKNLLNPGKIVGPDPSRAAWPLRPAVRSQRPGVGSQEPVAPSREPLASAPVASLAVSCSVASAGLEGLDPRRRGRALLRVRRLPDAHAPERMCPGVPRHRATRPRPRAPRRTCSASLDGTGRRDARRGAGGRRPVRQLQDVPRRVRRQVNMPKLMLEAKAAHQAEHGSDAADWLLARAEGFAAFGSNFAPLVNGLLARRSVRWVMEKLFGLSRRRRLPAFALAQLLPPRRGPGMSCEPRVETREPSSFIRVPTRHHDPKVAYFVDIFADYNDPLIGEAAVAVLRHNGVEVYVPPRQVGCGMAALASGDVETAREAAAAERPRPRRPRPRGLPHRLLRADRGAHAVAGLPRPARRPRHRLASRRTPSS